MVLPNEHKIKLVIKKYFSATDETSCKLEVLSVFFSLLKAEQNTVVVRILLCVSFKWSGSGLPVVNK